MPVRLIFGRALAAGVVSMNPTTGLDMPTGSGRRDRIATPAGTGALLAASADDDKAVWAVALYAGLRAGEIAGLNWDCVDFERGVLVVKRAWCARADGVVEPKSRAGRRGVPMVAPLRHVLMEHRVRTGRRVGLVFARDGQRPFSYPALKARTLAACKRASVPPLQCDLDASQRDDRPVPEFGYLTLHEARHT